MSTLALTEGLFGELARRLDDPRESAGFILAGRSEHGGELTLLGRRVVWIAEDAYTERLPNRLDIPAGAFVPTLGEAAAEGAVAIFFHTHPGADPAPSRPDGIVDEGLHETVEVRTGIDTYASLILGGRPGAETFSGRVHHQGRWGEIGRLRIVGHRLDLRTHAGEPAARERYDRQIRAFGAAGQSLLGALHVGVVGAGGTGSAVFEQLLRLGVGRLTVVDDDTLDESNLTRIHESAAGQRGRPKVEVAAEAAARISPETQVDAVLGRVTERSVAERLLHCDLIFGCTDDNAGRAVLSRIAYWYLIPLLDSAFLVDTDHGRVAGLFGRVTAVGPGEPCLQCRGRIDLRLLGAEVLPEEERERLAAEGYVPGLGEPDPSVGPYTTLVGALAVAEMLERLFGLGAEDAPPGELLLRLHERSLNSLGGRSVPGHYCADPAVWGRGDEDPLLGQLWAGRAGG